MNKASGQSEQNEVKHCRVSEVSERRNEGSDPLKSRLSQTKNAPYLASTGCVDHSLMGSTSRNDENFE